MPKPTIFPKPPRPINPSDREAQRRAEQMDQRMAMAAAPAPAYPYTPESAFSIVDAIKRHRGLMSVPELAAILNVSDDVVYRMVRNGRIPLFIIPGSKLKRFDPASLVFHLSKHNPILKQVQKAS